MATPIVIRVTGKGLTALWTDKLDLTKLGGRVTVTRASDVGWNEKRQEWVAREAKTGKVIARGKNREACIEAEVRFFNRKLGQAQA